MKAKTDAEMQKIIDNYLKMEEDTIFTWGAVADYLEENGIFVRRQVKEFLDEVGYEERGFKSFIYEQMKLRRKRN